MFGRIKKYQKEFQNQKCQNCVAWYVYVASQCVIELI